ncbi:MAG: hypothetical protein FWE04_03365 [Oscillospiraceae bacterium]|nr:hypothetical protein [Oscillospiraceae bacterium]
MRLKIGKINGIVTEQQRVLSLPKPLPELNAFLMDMGIDKNNGFKYEVSGIRTGHDLLDEVMANYKNVDELNYIAEFMRNRDEGDIERIVSIAKSEQSHNAKDFINIMHNSGHFEVYNAPDFEELGKEIAFAWDGVDDESPLGLCINFKEYGESFHDSHVGKFAGGKYILLPDSQKIVYDGVMLPGTDEFSANADVLLSTKITTRDLMGTGEDNPSGIWIELPTTQYELERTAHRLGAENLADCVIYDSYTTRLPLDHNFYEVTDPLNEINTLMEILSKYDSEAIDKFLAVVEYEGNPELDNLINCTYNLDCYDYDPEIKYKEDFPSDYHENEHLCNMIAENGEITSQDFIAVNDGKRMVEDVYIRPDEIAEQQAQRSQPSNDGGLQLS